MTVLWETNIDDSTLKITLHQTHILWNAEQVRSAYHQEQMELAALKNTQIFSNLINLGLVKDCPTIAVTFTLSPLVVHVLGIRSSQLSGIRQTFQNRFDSCMTFLAQLGEIYWHALFYAQFFQLAISIVKQEPPRSSGDALTSFLYQPISLGHLTILQRYQNEMRTHADGQNPGIPRLGSQNLSLSPPSQGVRPSSVQISQTIQQVPQLDLQTQNMDLESHPFQASSVQAMETPNVNEWLRKQFSSNNIVPFA